MAWGGAVGRRQHPDRFVELPKITGIFGIWNSRRVKLGLRGNGQWLVAGGLWQWLMVNGLWRVACGGWLVAGGLWQLLMVNC